jgi:hypothetical protein
MLIHYQGIADAFCAKHPSGSATVTQFKSRPQILTKQQKNHRPNVMSFAEAVFSPFLPPPTPESIK